MARLICWLLGHLPLRQVNYDGKYGLCGRCWRYLKPV